MLGKVISVQRLCFLVAVLLAASLHGQERVASAGRVLDKDRRPVVGATVTFVGSEPPVSDRFDPADVVEVVTDERGRFRVRLLPLCFYSGWAAGPADADGACMVSRTVDVLPGSGFELQLRDRAEPTQIVLTGMDAWQDLGPLRFEVALTNQSVHRRPLRLVEGVGRLPPRPSDRGWLLFVRGREGELLYGKHVRGKTKFAIPAPQKIPVRVVDDAGAPVAGASIHLLAGDGLLRSRNARLGLPRHLHEWRIVGKTDAGGTTTVTVPSPASPFDQASTHALLLANAPGHAASMSGWYEMLFVDGKAAADPLVKRELPFCLKRSDWRGRCVDAAGLPVASRTLELTAIAPLELAPSVHIAMPFSLQVRTGVDGLVEAGLPPGLEACMVHVARDPAAGASVRSPALCSVEVGKAFDLDFTRLGSIAVEATSSAGLPARHVTGILVPMLPAANQSAIDASTYVFRLGKKGQAKIPAQPGRWLLFLTDGREAAYGAVKVDARRSSSIAVKLQALPSISGTVHLADGVAAEPIKFAINMVENDSTEEEVVLALRTIGGRVNGWLTNDLRTGAEGAFVLRYFDVPETLYRGRLSCGGESVQVILAPDQRPIDIDLRE